ncbi:MAG: hypothetical protein LBT15_00435, partial [Synergistaceae bacterium]|nr:hypothetical protein [Synergistaceae bacterium]
MLYLVIGIMLVVAMGAIITQRSRHQEVTTQAEEQPAPDGKGDAKTGEAGASAAPGSAAPLPGGAASVAAPSVAGSA